MVNSNPETVSTDYDTLRPPVLPSRGRWKTCWRSWHEQEKPVGVIVQFGGQTPLKLAPR